MARIDVTDLLTDPDFVDPCTLIHRTSVVSTAGVNTITEQPFSTFGSVQPATGMVINRLPDELRMVSISSFWIKGKIIADGKCEYPDIICFKGNRYEVQIVFDYTNWGQGWCEGICVREKPSL